MNSLTDLTVAQLRQAAELKEKIDALTTELSAIFEGKAVSAPAARGTLSQSERMKAYWAAKRASKGGTGTGNPGKQKGKRTMSPEARAKIAAAQKARWAKLKTGK